MPAYVMASIEVTDPEAYQQYVPGARASIEAHGGRMLAVDQNTEVLEGPAPGAPSFSSSPTRRRRRRGITRPTPAPHHLRLESAKSTLVIADGFVPPAGPVGAEESRAETR